MKKLILFLIICSSLVIAQRSKIPAEMPVTNYVEMKNNPVVFHKYLGNNSIKMSTVTRKVFLEEGTNTSCPYCAQYNPSIKEFMDANPDSLVSVTYHVHWPGVNDPMYQANTTQIAQRINYIGINAVPRVDIDGIRKDVYPFTVSNLSNNMNSRISVATPVEVEVFDEYVGEDSIKAVVTVSVLEQLPAGSYKLRIFAVDREVNYAYPPGNNGEKSFEYVFRRAYPNMNGTNLDLETGNHEYTVTYPIEDVWENGLIYTVAFIQNDANKEIMNVDFSNFYYEPKSPKLNIPANNVVSENYNVKFEWLKAPNTDYYQIQVSSDSLFSNLLVDAGNIDSLSYNYGSFEEGNKIYWRVKSFKENNPSDFSDAWSFASQLEKPTEMDGNGDHTKIDISWVDNSEKETKYIIERSVSSIGAMFSVYDSVAANVTSYTDNFTSSNTIYQYRVQAINEMSHSDYSDVVKIDLKTTDVDETENQVYTFNLDQNFPNPFNPSTTISFTIPSNENESFVNLAIYDLLGNKVTDLVSENMKSGKHQVKFTPDNLASGVYIYSLKAGNYKSTKKFIYMK